MTSVPGLKTITISDKSVTDLERRTSSPGTPLRACSSGTVINSSTAEADRPMETVWTSTLGGANSGNTSIAESFIRAMPKIISTAARKTTRYLYRKLVATIHLMRHLLVLLRNPGLGAVNFRNANRHNRSVRLQCL